MTLSNDNYYHVVLSLLGMRWQRNYLSKRNDYSPREIFERIEHDKRKTVAHLIDIFGADPEYAAHKVIERCERQGYNLLVFGNDDYPALLENIDDPPLVLYTAQQLPPRRCVAIVGTRNADASSAGTARRLARELAQAGVCIVSGMAIGVDRAAHTGALDAAGATVGVLGGGVDGVYPRSNSDIYLAMRQRENTAIISEFPPGAPVLKWAFVKRNRVISGLCEAVVIVKAAEKSGALITADFAIEQNRELFACCGMPYDPEYAGCVALVNQGAHCVYDSTTILDVLEIRAGRERVARIKRGEAEGDNYVLSCVCNGIHDIDEIGRRAGVSQEELQQQLTLLELEEQLVRSGNRIFLR